MTKVVLALGASLGALALAACDAPSSQDTASETGVPATIVESPAVEPVEAAPAAKEAGPEDVSTTSEVVEDLPATEEATPPPSN